MFADLVEACAALLRDIAGQIQEVRHQAPVEGCVWQRESALDETVGDADFPVPYGFAHHVHRTLNYATGERLETLSWCMRPGFSHIVSATDLARAAAEAASAAVWLGHEEADGERRLRRLLQLVRKSDGDHRGLQVALGVVPSPRPDGIDDWAGRRGLKAESYGSREALLVAADAAGGSVHYKRLSAFNHSSVSAMIAFYTEIDQAQHGDSRMIDVHAASVATVAASYSLGALSSLERITGVGQPELSALHSRLTAVEDGVEWAAEQVTDLGL